MTSSEDDGILHPNPPALTTHSLFNKSPSMPTTLTWIPGPDSGGDCRSNPHARPTRSSQPDPIDEAFSPLGCGHPPHRSVNQVS
jgi:hypothetical protein